VGIFLAAAMGAVAQSPYSRAKVINSGALVYKGADFDSPVLGKLGAGKIYEVFPQPFGAFYRIKVGKIFGYIADNDVQIIKGSLNSNPQEAKEVKTAKPAEDEKQVDEPKGRARARVKNKRKRRFSATRYLGLSYSSNSYKEDTLGSKRSEANSYFGLKLTSPENPDEGESPSELNLQIYFGAPRYYEALTGVSGSGFIFLGDYQFIWVSSLSPVVLSWIGFGPLFRVAKFELGLRDPSTSKVTGYQAEDLGIGVVFSLGMAFRMGNFALRPEFKYYWEKEQYFGAGAALQFEF
jgi:hypothetical protein